jgi:hypothetical protein
VARHAVALTWRSLTFPVGTFVIGTTQLAVHTNLPAFKVAAVIAYVGLLCTWLLVAVRTTHAAACAAICCARPRAPARCAPARTRSPSNHEWDRPNFELAGVSESRSCRLG